jgi:hypothetical protein
VRRGRGPRRGSRAGVPFPGAARSGRASASSASRTPRFGTRRNAEEFSPAAERLAWGPVRLRARGCGIAGTRCDRPSSRGGSLRNAPCRLRGFNFEMKNRARRPLYHIRTACVFFLTHELGRIECRLVPRRCTELFPRCTVLSTCPVPARAGSARKACLPGRTRRVLWSFPTVRAVVSRKTAV